jgi:hypothetical protein
VFGSAPARAKQLYVSEFRELTIERTHRELTCFARGFAEQMVRAPD